MDIKRIGGEEQATYSLITVPLDEAIDRYSVPRMEPQDDPGAVLREQRPEERKPEPVDLLWPLILTP